LVGGAVEIGLNGVEGAHGKWYGGWIRLMALSRKRPHACDHRPIAAGRQRQVSKLTLAAAWCEA
jgi:hypothetical protein